MRRCVKRGCIVCILDIVCGAVATRLLPAKVAANPAEPRRVGRHSGGGRDLPRRASAAACKGDVRYCHSGGLRRAASSKQIASATSSALAESI